MRVRCPEVICEEVRESKGKLSLGSHSAVLERFSSAGDNLPALPGAVVLQLAVHNVRSTGADPTGRCNSLAAGIRVERPMAAIAYAADRPS